MTYRQGRRFSPKNTSFRGKRTFGTKRKFEKENIDPSKFIKKAVTEEVSSYEASHTFSDFSFVPSLSEKLSLKGFTAPSPIQDQTIAPALEGRDIIGIANTGTGKTLAFALPILHKLLTDRKAHTLILAPTRELSEQIFTQCVDLLEGERIHHALLIGGVPIRKQLKDLSYRPRLVIGTPGRVKDHIERETIALRFFNLFVLDEVDRMLDMGFVKDIRLIMEDLSQTRQSFFFSATMDKRVRTLIDEFSNDPLYISVKTGTTTDQVEQNVIHYSTVEEKIEKLEAVLEANATGKFLIFEETKRSVERLGKDLLSKGFLADSMHGDKSQSQRKQILKKFRIGRTRILVATDVAARGIDIADITHIINYTTPQTYSDYVHRIGRAGRAGKKGYALTFLPTKKTYSR